MSRAFVRVIVVLALFTAPLAVEAQLAGNVKRVGIIMTTTPISDLAGSDPAHPAVRAFVHGLRNLGYVEGQNLIVERRSAEGQWDRLPAIVSELLSLNPDVIVSVSNSVTREAKALTSTVPIVMAASLDPVEAGFAEGLARPGGNITGLSWSVGPEIEAKRLELLREVVPRLTRVAYLRGDTEASSPGVQSVRAAAQLLRITLVEAEHAGDDFSQAFMTIRGARAAALFVSVNPAAFALRKIIADFAKGYRLPSMHAFRESVEAGGLMSYGVSGSDLFRRAASYVDRILRGANPADLPIEQPTKFELVINLKTAKALGLTIPPSVLARADEVIE